MMGAKPISGGREQFVGREEKQLASRVMRQLLAMSSADSEDTWPGKAIQVMPERVREIRETDPGHVAVPVELDEEAATQEVRRERSTPLPLPTSSPAPEPVRDDILVQALVQLAEVMHHLMVAVWVAIAVLAVGALAVLVLVIVLALGAL
jgi:hypothetical protein